MKSNCLKVISPIFFLVFMMPKFIDILQTEIVKYYHPSPIKTRINRTLAIQDKGHSTCRQ